MLEENLDDYIEHFDEYMKQGKHWSAFFSRGATKHHSTVENDFLNKWLEDESASNNETIFDRFELNYGRGVTKSGEQTVEGTFQLSEMKTGGRKVYYLSAEKDKYDAYNYGLRLVFRFE